MTPMEELRIALSFHPAINAAKAPMEDVLAYAVLELAKKAGLAGHADKIEWDVEYQTDRSYDQVRDGE